MIASIRSVPSSNTERAVICEAAHGAGQRLATANAEGLWLFCKACRQPHCYPWSALLRLLTGLAPELAQELMGG